MKRERVLANMVIGANGATSLNHDSAPLSPPADRKRFHEIRSMGKALVVGGNTFRREHYSKAPMPVYVATRTPTPSTSTLFYVLAAPEVVVKKALDENDGAILIEGGIRFIAPLIEKAIIDRLFITRSPISGDGDFFDSEHLHRHYQLQTSHEIDGLTFEEWVPKAISD
jgi:dihydrofolate reductase